MKETAQIELAGSSSPATLDLFRALFEQAAMGIAQIETATGRFLRVNQRYADIVGYSRAEMERLDFQTLTHPDDLAVDLNNLRRLVAGEIREFTLEKRYRRRDCAVVWVSLTVLPLWAPGGPTRSHIALVEDITARKQAEASLSQRAAELAALSTLGRTVNTTLSLEEVTKAALTEMRNAVQPDLAFLFLQDGERLILKEVLPAAARVRLGVIPEHRVGQCICGLAVRDKKPLFCRDIFQDIRCTWEECKKAGIKSFAALPLVSGDEVIGVVGLASEKERDFERQGEFLETLAGQVSVALANARLYETAQRELAERKRAEEALRESESRFRAVVENAQAIIFMLDAEGRFRLSEGLGLARLGLSPGQVVGQSALEMYRGIPSIQEGIQAALAGRTIRTTNVLRGAAFDSVYSPYFAPDGRQDGVVGIAIDVTERLRAEAASRENQERLALALEGANLGSWDWNIETGEVNFNERWAQMLGYEASELEPHLRSWERLVHPEDMPRVREVLEAHLEGRVPFYETEHRMRHKSGSWVWVLDRGGVISRDPGGKPIRAVGTHLDITERKGIQETLIRIYKAVECASDAIGMADAQGRHFYQNKAFTDLFEYSTEEINATDGKPAGYVDNNAAREVFATIMSGGSWSGEVEMKSKSGRRFPVRMRADAIKDEDGRVIGLLGVHTDITERKRAEEEREKLRSQLTQAQKMESVGRLAGGVAHDFNNMLQAILGNAALALQDLPPESPVRECLEEIEKAALRSADLTRQLLAFARKQTIAPKVLDLNSTVAGMFRMLRRLIGEDIDLSWMPGENLWSVKMDPSQIDQVLANLCVNARDAIEGVGTVTIETTNVTLDAAYVATHPEVVAGEYVLLAVSDTGKGMDVETRSHLFEPFFTTKERGKGTGLGLATVFGIVKQNLGVISVYSEPGQGTTFKIYLPRAEAQPLAAVTAVRKRDPRGTETVLLVEDEDQILVLAQRVLQQHGYTVLAARSPEAALKLAKQHAGQIHLLITDVVMPGMHGRALRNRLAALRPELRCLYMSGYTADVIAHHGVLDEGVQFLQKPFTIESLAERVRETLEQPLETGTQCRS